MKAITRIEETGISAPRIAEAIHVTTHAVRHYKLMQRFPNKHVYTSLVQCAATGSNLLRQFIDLQNALGEVCEVTRLADLMRQAA